MDIYTKIENDCKKYLTENYSVKNEDKMYFDYWLSEYVINLDEIYKNNIVSTYGFSKLMNKLPKIAHINHYTTIDAFIQDEYSVSWMVIYIIKNEILKDNYDEMIEAFWNY